jgi:hypothetical protein
MKRLFNLIKKNAVSIAVMAILTSITVWGLQQPQQKVYDCTMSEFHPDYPIKVREACRELRRANEKSK